MKRKAVEKILSIQEQAVKDEDYKTLLAEYALRDAQMQELYKILPKDQRMVIAEYLGVCISMHLRLLELVCSEQQGDN